jgi:ankyrin repeat protein
LIKELLEPQSSRFYNWVRLFDHCEFDKEEWMPKTDFTKSPSSIPSPFFYASLVGLEETLACLALDRRVDANEEFRGKAALEVAASQGYEAVVQILLDRGAGHPNNLALTGDSGCYSYALREALHGGHKAIVQLLLDHWEEDSYTLQWASSICHMEIVQLLLDKGVDINAQSQKYGSALTAASSRGYKTIVQLLLDNGANVNAQNGESKSALTAAPSEEIVQVLLGNPIELKVVQSLLNITPYASVRGE